MSPAAQPDLLVPNGIPDRVLVCGLGSLGQHCVATLRQFGLQVSAIEEAEPQSWEFPDLRDWLEDFVVGDCRQPSVLRQAQIQRYRAILLVTSNEQVNLETAFAVRALGSEARLVVRSAKQNLNEQVGERLKNFVAFEPTDLPAPAFSVVAAAGELRGFFELEGKKLQVMKRQVPTDVWRSQNLIKKLNSPSCRVLSHSSDASQALNYFSDWQADTELQPGDTVVYIEVTDEFTIRVQRPQRRSRPYKQRFWKSLVQDLSWGSLKQRLSQLWQVTDQNQAVRAALISGFAVLVFLVLGAVLFQVSYLDSIEFQDALNVTVVLMLGGFDNLFGRLTLPFEISLGLYLFSLIMTVVGTTFVGILFALLNEYILSSRFQFAKRRPPVPQKDHVVLIGLGRVGQRVAALLQTLNQPVVGISPTALDSSILPQMPLLVGNVINLLERVNLDTAKSIVAATDDEMLNLEVGLMAHSRNPQSRIAIRIFGQRLTEHLAQLLPYARILCAYDLAAQAFATAAFGENILRLFRANNHTVLVVDYEVKPDDAFAKLSLSDIAHRYGVVPIFHQSPQRNGFSLIPPYTTTVQAGDRLVVLAEIDSIKRIEQTSRHVLQ